MKTRNKHLTDLRSAWLIRKFPGVARHAHTHRGRPKRGRIVPLATLLALLVGPEQSYPPSSRKAGGALSKTVVRSHAIPNQSEKSPHLTGSVAGELPVVAV